MPSRSTAPPPTVRKGPVFSRTSPPAPPTLGLNPKPNPEPLAQILTPYPNQVCEDKAINNKADCEAAGKIWSAKPHLNPHPNLTLTLTLILTP